MRAMEISRSALEVEWRRLEVIAENLANANTASTALGAPYQAMRLVSGPKTDFAAAVQGANPTPTGVTVYGLEPINAPPRRTFEPTNPQADAEGYVSYPGYDHAVEMTLMVKTARAYEASVVALTAATRMYSRALELGRKP